MVTDLDSVRRHLENMLFHDNNMSVEMRYELGLALHYVCSAIKRDKVENRQGWNWGMKVM